MHAQADKNFICVSWIVFWIRIDVKQIVELKVNNIQSWGNSSKKPIEMINVMCISTTTWSMIMCAYVWISMLVRMRMLRTAKERKRCFSIKWLMTRSHIGYLIYLSSSHHTTSEGIKSKNKKRQRARSKWRDTKMFARRLRVVFDIEAIHHMHA